MADLSNLLGAVYGEGSPSKDSDEARDPDGPPTPVEKAAHQRGPVLPLADDLAAALSEALVAVEAEEDDLEADDLEEAHSAPHLSPERAAAVELMHASRPESEPFAPLPQAIAAPEPAPVEDEVDEPEPEPEPEFAPLRKVELINVADLPHMSDDYKPVPAPKPVVSAPMPAATDVTPLVGPSRWERSDDDILPTKGGGGGKKFFSLRRG